MESIYLLNVRIDNLTSKELLEQLTKGVLVTPNVDDIMKHQKDEEFHKYASMSEFSICDSRVVKLMSSIMRKPLKEAIPGSTFFPMYCQYHAKDEHVKVFLLGAKEGVEHLHIDMMDGTFVPNFGLGVDYIRGLRELTDIPLDLHLMIKDPEYKLRWIGIKPTDMVSVHYESTYQVQRLLDWLKPYGCKRFLAINPATPVGNIEEVLDYVDGINLLMVNPGFASQHIVPSTIRKAKKLVDLLKREHHEELSIEVDGNITPEHAKTLREIGANIFVGGTSSIFKGKVDNFAENIKILRDSIK